MMMNTMNTTINAGTISTEELKEFIREYLAEELELKITVTEPDWMQSSYHIEVQAKIQDCILAQAEDWFNINKE